MHNTLVIAAHPDDEVLGCGGTISRLADEGDEVYIAILGEGITARHPEQKKTNHDALGVLHNTSKKVSKLLQAKDLFLYHLPDNRFDTVPLLDIIKQVEKLIDQLQPNTIFTHHCGDLNIDHEITNRAVITATRPISGCSVKKIYAFEIPSSTDWAFGQFHRSFQPNVFFDIETTLETKLNAMKLYASEVKSFPHPRSLTALEAVARRLGSIVGYKAAEAFELIREIR